MAVALYGDPYIRLLD